jgi:DNA-directed RNA polymerase subunit L
MTTEQKKIDLYYEDEDYTLGIFLQSRLLRNENVIIAGAKVPHPLERKLQITYELKDSSKKTFNTIIENSITDLEKLKQEFISKLMNHTHDKQDNLA